MKKPLSIDNICFFNYDKKITNVLNSNIIFHLDNEFKETKFQSQIVKIQEILTSRNLNSRIFSKIENKYTNAEIILSIL